MTLLTTALRAVDALAERFGILDTSLELDDLVDQAQRHAGLHDFGDLSFCEPLRRLLDAIRTESSLGAIGRMATRWDVVRFLTNLLQMQAHNQRDPAIEQQPIVRPIFIAGLPRSGTTFLHRLMLEDPANRGPLVWETIFPYPEGPGPDNRARNVARQLRMFERMAPEFRALHPLDANSPQECSEITAHVFRSLRFDTNYRIPSYAAWLDADESRSLPGWRFHKRFLQHLQHQAVSPPTRWVLKCPEHVFTLASIRAVYPDARIVFVHRDPVKVLLSQAHLTEVLRRPFMRRIDPAEIGRQESARWRAGTQYMMDAGETGGFTQPICHVHHMDLVSDPLDTVAGVYRHFGLEMPPDVAGRITTYVRRKPNGGYGPRKYSFQDHGLNAEAEREKFRPYMVHFGIVPEDEARKARDTVLPAPLLPGGTETTHSPA